MLQGFPPVVAPNTHTMILGSFPGEASLDAAQYYAHPRNQFWRLLGAVLGEPTPAEQHVTRWFPHGFMSAPPAPRYVGGARSRAERRGDQS